MSISATPYAAMDAAALHARPCAPPACLRSLRPRGGARAAAAAPQVAALHAASPAFFARSAGVAARAVAGVKDRGEWTRFLEWTDDAARASVDCELLAGGAAEVTVVAPDRPGLLSDIAATIASLGLNIEKVRCWRRRRGAPHFGQGPPMPGLRRAAAARASALPACPLAPRGVACRAVRRASRRSRPSAGCRAAPKNPRSPSVCSAVLPALTHAPGWCTHAQARVTTPGSSAKDTFRVTCKSGEPLTDTRMSSIRTAIVNGASKSGGTSALKPASAQARSTQRGNGLQRAARAPWRRPQSQVGDCAPASNRLPRPAGALRGGCRRRDGV
jgi:hypothetical protein